MNAPIQPHRFILEPFEAHRFANLCGQFDEHLRLIEQRLAIEIRNRGNQFELIGEPKTTSAAEQLLRRLYREAKATELSPETVHLYLQESTVENIENPAVNEVSVSLRTRKGMIRPRGANQQRPSFRSPIRFPQYGCGGRQSAGDPLREPSFETRHGSYRRCARHPQHRV